MTTVGSRNIVVTWPKGRPLESYLTELARAQRGGLVINYRVPHPPWEAAGGRCYMVHSGAVRGWNRIRSVELRKRGEVTDPITGAPWPEGFYIVRDPRWHPIEPIEMRGFQGWRYFTWDNKAVEPYRPTLPHLLGLSDY